MNRRSFLKLVGLGILGGGAAKGALWEKITYPHFVLGQPIRHAIRSVPCWDIPLYSSKWHHLMLTLKKAQERLLTMWMKRIIPPKYFDPKKIKFKSKLFDYDTVVATSGHYKYPE